VRLEQVALAAEQGGGPGFAGEFVKLALQMNELPPACTHGVALVDEPVGEDAAREVIGGAFQNILQESVLVRGHVNLLPGGRPAGAGRRMEIEYHEAGRKCRGAPKESHAGGDELFRLTVPPGTISGGQPTCEKLLAALRSRGSTPATPERINPWKSHSPSQKNWRIASLPDPRDILALRPTEALQQRIDHLLEKNQTAGLSAEEQREWQQYRYVEHLVRLAKARAALALEGT
jgi:hypothetical protein